MPASSNKEIDSNPRIEITDWVHVWAYPLLGAQDRFEEFNP
jgi:hypothetical protein